MKPNYEQEEGQEVETFEITIVVLLLIAAVIFFASGFLIGGLLFFGYLK